MISLEKVREEILQKKLASAREIPNMIEKEIDDALREAEFPKVRVEFDQSFSEEVVNKIVMLYRKGHWEVEYKQSEFYWEIDDSSFTLTPRHEALIAFD